MPRNAARQTDACGHARGLLRAVPICVLLLLPAARAAGSAQPVAPTAKQTTFSGAIASGTGKFAHVRGGVRLVLQGSMTPAGLVFKLTLGGPPCASRKPQAPDRCVVLVGTLTGRVTPVPTNPDAGSEYALLGSGRATVVGRVHVKGTTRGVGFIAHGRFPLMLTLRNSAGTVAITAQGPLVSGFSSPF